MSDKKARSSGLSLRKTILAISIATAAIVLLLLLLKEITTQREVVPLQTPLPSAPAEDAAPAEAPVATP